MKSRFVMIGAGLLAMIVSACAMDTPSVSTDPEDDPALDPPAIPDPLDGSTGQSPDVAGRPCPAGSICLYQNANYTGCMVQLRPPQRNLDLGSETCQNSNFNNQMTSWNNNSGTRYCWWVDVGERGNEHLMNPHTKQPRVSEQANDRASAVGPC